MSTDGSAAESGSQRGPSLARSLWARVLYLLGVISLRALVGVVIWMLIVMVVIDPQNGLRIHPARLITNPVRLVTSQSGMAVISVFGAYWAAVWVYVPVRTALSSAFARVRWVLSACDPNTPVEDSDGEL